MHTEIPDIRESCKGLTYSQRLALTKSIAHSRIVLNNLMRKGLAVPAKNPSGHKPTRYSPPRYHLARTELGEAHCRWLKENDHW